MHIVELNLLLHVFNTCLYFIFIYCNKLNTKYRIVTCSLLKGLISSVELTDACGLKILVTGTPADFTKALPTKNQTRGIYS